MGAGTRAKRTTTRDGQAYRVQCASPPGMVDAFSPEQRDAIGNFKAIFEGLGASGFLGSLPKTMPKRLQDALGARGGPPRW